MSCRTGRWSRCRSNDEDEDLDVQGDLVVVARIEESNPLYHPGQRSRRICSSRESEQVDLVSSFVKVHQVLVGVADKGIKVPISLASLERGVKAECW